jgi:hypothetical protein
VIGLFGVTACSHASRSGVPVQPAPPSPLIRAVVTGGIEQCDGLGVSRNPKYMAGTVSVLEGKIRLKREGRHNVDVLLPTHVIKRTSVARNAEYRFVLPVGHYVLKAHVSRPVGYGPAAPFTVRDATTLHVDIPNDCI